MTILIDTSAWVEFFRRNGEARTKTRVAECVRNREAAYTCPILMELLVGARPIELEAIHEARQFSKRIMFQPDDWERAAKLQRDAREKGVTIPRDDILIATVALDRGMRLLCRDHHFSLLASKIGINLEIEQLA